MIIGKFINKIGYVFAGLMICYLVNPYNLNIYVSYIIIAYIYIHKDFLINNLDKNFVLLFLFSITYALFFFLNEASDSIGIQYIIVYATVPCAFYLMGKYASSNLQNNEISIFYLLFFIGVIYSLTPLLSVLSNIMEFGYATVDRNLPNFWTGEIILATKMGAFFTLNMCIPSILIVGRIRAKTLFYTFSIILFLVSVACVLRIGSRTQLGISLVTLFLSLLYIMPRQSFKRNLITFTLFGLLIFGIISNVNFDLDQDWLSAFAGRMENDGAGDLASGGGRTERWVKSIQFLFEKPLGWGVEEFGHAHNMWLDVLRISGFIPFIMLFIFSIKSFINIKEAIYTKREAYAFNNLLFIYGMAFFMVFMVEPIFEGTFDLFAIFCFFIGTVNKYKFNERIIE